eukprot:TRINITY_DN22432_c0_g2_i2.p1 TRINITY_DN22432_c0_g2~~TRINITY_DN22432_c0_g2_i2.p1  ORF type:complete len:272 (-),score=87.28 TRINITY_DN22432_c0_g2_i2:82-897(-)
MADLPKSIAPSEYIDPVRRKFIKRRTGAPNELDEAMKDPELWTDSMPYHFFSFAGGPRVGKTSIVNRMFDRPFDPEEKDTVGGRFMFDIGPYGAEKDMVSVWDCSGSVYTDWHVRKDDKGKYLRELKYIAPNARMNRMIYRKQMRKTMSYKQTAILIVYDSTDRKSFDGVPDTVTGRIVNGVDMFYRWARYRGGQDALIALISAKNDLPNTEVTRADGEAKVAEWNALHGDNCYFFETSAKSNSGIQEMTCLLYTSPSPRDRTRSRMPSSA